MVKPSHARALALVLISALCFGTLAIFGKRAYAAGIEPATLLAWRFTGAAIGLWVIAIAARAPLPHGREWSVPVWLGLGYFFQSAAYFSALHRIPASETSLLLYTFPALVLIGSVVWFGERLTPLKIEALIAALIGTVLVVGGHLAKAAPLGIALGLLSSIGYTGYILYGNRALPGVPRLTTSASVMTVAGLAFVAVTLLTNVPLTVSSVGWAPLAGVVLVATVIPVWFFIAGMPAVGASESSIVSTLEPATTVVLAIGFLGERLTLGAALGTLLILGATIAIALGNRRIAPAPH